MNDTEKVNEYMQELDHPFHAEIEAVRAIIMNANSKMKERIKWNAPSFFYKEDMTAFNPREHKKVHLIFLFPKGVVAENTGLLEGNYQNRRMLFFKDMEEVNAKKVALEKVVNDWVELMDK